MTEPIIKIGERTITAAEAVSLMAKYRLLPQLAREIIIDQAIADIDCTEADMQQACEQLFQQQRLMSDVERQSWMKAQGLTPEQVQHMAARQFKIEQFKQTTWSNRLQSYFLKRKGRLDKVIYSLLRVKDAGTAQELYFRLVDDQQSFDDLAREYSEGPEAQTGGLLGPVDLGTPNPALARMLSVSQPGQLWPPTPLGNWFVIVRLEKFLPAQLDEPMQRQLLDELFNTWLKEQLQAVSLESAASAPATDQAATDSPPDQASDEQASDEQASADDSKGHADDKANHHAAPSAAPQASTPVNNAANPADSGQSASVTAANSSPSSPTDYSTASQEANVTP
jgi:parvulin-like peptidyl-prolyl isomerase